MTRLNLTVDGMGCVSCVRKVKGALAAVPGVEVENVAIGSATVAYDPTKTSDEAVVSALAAAGYAARTREVVHGCH